MIARFSWVIAALCLPLFCAASSVSVKGQASWAVGALHPAISPDGKSLAVSYQGAIGTLPLKGGILKLLTRGEGWDLWPTWSPDGKRIAYVNAPYFTSGLIRMIDADGNPVQLPKRVVAAGPIWFHPDGRRIFGKISVRGYPRVVTSFDVQTGELKPVAGYPDSWSVRRGAYALSPDGEWVYFGAQYDEQGQQGGLHGAQTDVYRLPSSGGKPAKLFQWPDRIYHLAVAPKDGGLYVMTDHNTAHNDIWHLPTEEPVARARRLTHGIADEDWPFVSADGKTLTYTDNRGGATALAIQHQSDRLQREVVIRKIDHSAPVKRFRLRLPQRHSKRPEAWRVSVKRKGGKYHSPPGSMYHISAGLGYFVHRGDLDLTVPVGEYEIHVLRGPEHHLDLINVTLSADGKVQEFNSAISRWVDARKEGWYSGENHIHANYGYGQWYNTPRSMLDMCEAEDLHVANLVVANSDSDAIFDREFFSGGPDPLSTDQTVLWWNEEFRSTIWGHMTLFHLKQLVEPIMTGFRNTTNPWDIPTNADILQRTRMQRGSAGYTHPTNNREDAYDQPYSAKGLPVDAALGLVDCADFMGVVYDQALDYWYKLLNAGFRLPASAGTDCFLNRVSMSPPGWARAYVHLPDGFTYEGWVDGLKKGRSFVSNGPMLDFSVNDKSAGDTIKLEGAGKLNVVGRVRSAHPLEKLELIYNGKVVATGALDDSRTKGVLRTAHSVDESGWIALRASGKPVRFRTGRSHSAHTNPLYIHVKGRPQRVGESADYFLRWINRLEADLRKRNRIPKDEWHEVLKLLDLARDVYVAKLKGKAGVIR